MILEDIDDPWPRRCELAGAVIVAAVVASTAASAWTQWDLSSTFTISSPGSIIEQSSTISSRLRMLANVMSPTMAALLLIGLLVTVADAVATGTAESRGRVGTITITVVGVSGLVFAVSGLVSFWDLVANSDRNQVFGVAAVRVERLAVAGLGMTALWLAASTAADAIEPRALDEIDADVIDADEVEP